MNMIAWLKRMGRERIRVHQKKINRLRVKLMKIRRERRIKKR